MKKIICFRNSKLGDYIVSIPALELIRKKNPKCKIYYLLAKNNFSPDLPKIIENNKIVDEFIYFNHNFYGNLKLIKYLRKIKFEKFYYLQEKSNAIRETRDYFFFSLLGIQDLNGFFSKKYDFKKFSETLQLAKRIDNTAGQSDVIRLMNFENKIEKPIYRGKYITISIGGFSQPALWKIEKWSILTSLITQNTNYKILILGTKNDISNCNHILKKNKILYKSLCGKTNIKQLFNIIKFSKIHITNDNGSMHVASLFSKKTLCLFNNHDPEGKWNPPNKNSIIIRPNDGVNTINPYKVYNKLKRFF